LRNTGFNFKELTPGLHCSLFVETVLSETTHFIGKLASPSFKLANQAKYNIYFYISLIVFTEVPEVN